MEAERLVRAIVIIWAEDDGGLDQAGHEAGGEECLDV